MKVKLSWGSAIFILIFIFFGSLAIRIYIAYQRDVNLVVNDYYPQEVIHQQIIDKKNNTAKLSQEVNVNFRNDTLLLNFPPEFENKSISGSITFYRPSDPKLDQEYQLKSTINRQVTLQVFNLKRGKYILKLDWKCENTAYYLEKEIFID